jgi:signal transduction histidine kinase/DNA-binding response OmpR family regulator
VAYSITSTAIHYEQDIVLARQRTRQIANALGFDTQDQTRLATAVSELARNAFGYAGGGVVDFHIEGQTAPQVFLIRVRDKGKGIPHLKQILDGSYRSRSGMGLGIIGARRLVDQCDIQTEANLGTTIVLKKVLPQRAPLVTTARLKDLTDILARQISQNPFDEVKQQNQELLRALSDLRDRQDELLRVNRELEDTNRGVVALYAELDERASHLRRADEMKTSFLSNMSHEFRTPLNSILALSDLLLDRADGELTDEQEIQVGFIRKGAGSLLELVNDLLDLAKIEAGKIEVHPIEFSVTTLFSALRGMLRPLLVGRAVNLVFEEPERLPLLNTDESKVSQILRNFISNALKFTEQGEVRVKAAYDEKAQSVRFSVTDTGIGIALEDQARIFEEFTQITNPVQRKVKGTGLGLPLCKKLAALLGGEIDLTSQLEVGSTFMITIPRQFAKPEEEGAKESRIDSWELDATRLPVLLVDDEPEVHLIYQKYLRESPFQIIPVGSIRQARIVMQQVQPRAIILDILLRGEDSWGWLTELKADDATKSIPILIASTVEDQAKGFALGADGYCLKPLDRADLTSQLTRLTHVDYHAESEVPAYEEATRVRVLVIDDDPAARYVIAKLLKSLGGVVHEAPDGMDGIRIARELNPELILLDLNMPGLSGFEVLDRLRADPLTRAIPIAIVTSASISEAERRRLEAKSNAIVSKSELSEERLGRLINAAQSESVVKGADLTGSQMPI